jgi:chromosome partitioning protein
VLVIDGDPGGDVSRALPCSTPAGTGVLSLIARSAALHLRRLNEARLERGDAPQPMDEALSAALPLTAADLIRPSLWPGLDVMAAPLAMMQGDRQITSWRLGLRTWAPGQALAQAVEEAGLRQRYGLILCDTPRGLGPMALALLASADVLLAPLPLRDDGAARLGAGLQALAEAMIQHQTEAQMAARALGQMAAASQAWQALWVLPNRAGEDAARQMAQATALLGEALVPTPLPEVTALADGLARQFYDLDYRKVGRLTYAPLREACDAAWRAVAERLVSLKS